MGLLVSVSLGLVVLVHLAFGFGAYVQVKDWIIKVKIKEWYFIKLEWCSVIPSLIALIVLCNIQGGIYSVDAWMVDGNPGAGNTPIEKLLALIFALWYLGSIFPVILTYLSGSAEGIQTAIMGPFFYHLSISINAFLFLESFNVCNPEITNANRIGIIHAILAAACYAVYRSWHIYQTLQS